MASQGPALDGLRAYLKMVNDAGGVKGNKINLIEQDDAYNVAKELGIVKSFINDDKVALVTGIGNSSGFSSILPLLNASKTPALVNQGTLKTNTYPFQPYMFQGNCNYGDQAEVALAYTMTRAKIKSLKGVKVGIAGIEVASGQEWIDTLKAKVEAAGGIAVTQTLPAAIVNADVAAQAFQDAGVKMILMHHSISGGIAMLRSIAKFGINVPISGSYGVTQDLLWTTAPYEATKNFVGTNCYTPPLVAEVAAGQGSRRDGQEGTASRRHSLAQTNYTLGWVNGMIIVQALKNIKGAVTTASMKEGLEGDQEPQHGRPLAADQPVAEVPHGDPAGASDAPTTGASRSPGSGRDVRPVVEVHHQHPGGARHVRQAKREVAPEPQTIVRPSGRGNPPRGVSTAAERALEEPLERLDEVLRLVELDRVAGALDDEELGVGKPGGQVLRVVERLHPVAVAVTDERRAGDPAQRPRRRGSTFWAQSWASRVRSSRQYSGPLPTGCSSSFR